MGAEMDVEVNSGGGTTRCRFLRTSSWSTCSLVGHLKCVYNPLQEHKAQGAASGLEIFLVGRGERSWTHTDQEKNCQRSMIASIRCSGSDGQHGPQKRQVQLIMNQPGETKFCNCQGWLILIRAVGGKQGGLKQKVSSY